MEDIGADVAGVRRVPIAAVRVEDEDAVRRPRDQNCRGVAQEIQVVAEDAGSRDDRHPVMDHRQGVR